MSAEFGHFRDHASPAQDLADLDERIESREGFLKTMPRALAAALEDPVRTIWFVDPDFAEWPLDQAGVIEPLQRWLRQPGRRLCLLACRFDGLDRSHPRFSAWRRDWMHAIEARTPADNDGLDLPTLLVDDRRTLMCLWERNPLRGRASRNPAAARIERDRVDAWWQRSEPAWPVRTLGL
jgi:hypothetical protein